MDTEYVPGGVDDTFNYEVVPSGEGYTLLHDGCKRGEINIDKYGKAVLQWYCLGPVSLDQAKAWLRGIVDLMLMGEELEHEAKKKAKQQPQRKGRMVRTK